MPIRRRIFSRSEKRVGPKKRMIVPAVHVTGPNGERSASILLNDENVSERKLAAVTSPNPNVTPDQDMVASPFRTSRKVQSSSTQRAKKTNSIHLFVSNGSLVTGRKNRGRMEQENSKMNLLVLVIELYAVIRFLRILQQVK